LSGLAVILPFTLLWAGRELGHMERSPMNLPRLGIHFLVIFGVIAGATSAAQDWAFARDKYSRAIDIKTDSIVVSLGTSRLPIRNTFLGHVKEAGAIIQVTVAGSATKNVNGATQTEEKSAVYPFGFRANVGGEQSGQVQLPFQGTPIKHLKLRDETDKNNKAEYTNLTFDITMVRLDEQNLWTKLLQRLIGIGQGASLPTSPFGIIAGYALSFANGALADALQSAGTGTDKKLPLGSRTLNFKVDRPVWTGTYLLILPVRGGKASQGLGYVDPNDMSRICLRRKEGPSDTIIVGTKRAGATGNDSEECPESTYVALRNPYVPIILETELTVVQGTASEQATIIEGKLAHCRMANLGKAACQDLFQWK
ncbi:MAG TPA: hypothetical protein VF135_06350, partial [Terriglobales bacterium]